MSIDFMGFLLVSVVMGIGLDWAFFWSFTNQLDMFYDAPKEGTYRHFMFPRLIFVGLAALIVGVGSYNDSNAFVIIVGATLFLIFSFYPHLVIFLRSKRSGG